jgi:hypothetical protein
MPDPKLMPALLEAFRVNEIGSKSPYEILFAAKGNSGGSFGAMQGDLAAGQAIVTKTFRDCLAASDFTASEIAALTARLSVHVVANPLSAGDTKRVNDALLAGKELVDAMDQSIMKDVLDDLDDAIATGAAAGHKIEPVAQLYIALWINMTGPPSKLLTWLKGGDPKLTTTIPAAGAVVGETAIQTYLKATKYFVENPKNWKHMLESVAAGVAKLP